MRALGCLIGLHDWAGVNAPTRRGAVRSAPESGTYQVCSRCFTIRCLHEPSPEKRPDHWRNLHHVLKAQGVRSS